MKEARASVLSSRIRLGAPTSTTTYGDNGVGGADARNGTGLIGQRERVEAIRGTM
jgi:signal transduction histidine kinase